MNNEITGYELSRKWFDFCFENPDIINPNHSAIFFFAIENCNRLGWKEKFGLPTQMAMDAIGIKKHQTYIKYFNDLVNWGFFNLVQKSSNQYSSNIISLSVGMLKNGKALDKAFVKHGAKQIASIGQSTGQSNSSIDKQRTINKEPLNKEQQKDISPDKNLFKISEEIKMPFTSENFRELWLNWKKYRHQEFKKKYKSIQSEQGALSHLAKISGGIEKNAFEIISNSIANQWQGLFELKNFKNGINQSKHYNGSEVSTESAFSKIDSMPDKT